MSVTIPANALATNGDHLVSDWGVRVTRSSGDFAGGVHWEFAGTWTFGATFSTTTTQTIVCHAVFTRLDSTTAELAMEYYTNTNNLFRSLSTFTGLDFTTTNTWTTVLGTITSGTGTVAQNALVVDVIAQ